MRGTVRGFNTKCVAVRACASLYHSTDYDVHSRADRPICKGTSSTATVVITTLRPNFTPHNGRHKWTIANALVLSLWCANSVAQESDATFLNKAPVATIEWSDSEHDLLDLAKAVGNAGEWDRADFARIAIESMLGEYVSVLDHAEGRKKHARWRNATQKFVANLRRLLDDIEHGATVDVHVDANVGNLLLLIGGQSVLLTSPRVAEQPRLESTVVTRFCALAGCEFIGQPRRDDARASYPAVYPAVAAQTEQESRTPAPTSGWSLSDGQRSTFETDDGLRFMFPDVAARKNKELICQRIARDLRLLTSALRTARAEGYSVDWRLLSFAAQKPPAMRVVLNADGRDLQLTLPSLTRAIGIAQISIPWLRARVEQRAHVQHFPRADLLLGKLL